MSRPSLSIYGRLLLYFAATAPEIKDDDTRANLAPHVGTERCFIYW